MIIRTIIYLRAYKTTTDNAALSWVVSMLAEYISVLCESWGKFIKGA